LLKFDFSISSDMVKPEWRCLELLPGRKTDVWLEHYIWTVLEEITDELGCSLDELARRAQGYFPAMKLEDGLWLYALDHARDGVELGMGTPLLH
jgi:hypothetical protein